MSLPSLSLNACATQAQQQEQDHRLISPIQSHSSTQIQWIPFIEFLLAIKAI